MNRKELVVKVANECGMTKAGTEKILLSILDTISDSMENGERVTFLGFGSFTIIERAARKGLNPKTGKAIKIPAKKIIKFKPGKELVHKVNS